MIIEGREYGPGIHEINGERIHVIDRSTYVSLGRIAETIESPAVEPLIDINEASAEELQELEGIGAAAANRIVAGRPFASFDDLIKVKGVTAKTIAANRERIVL